MPIDDIREILAAISENSYGSFAWQRLRLKKLAENGLRIIASEYEKAHAPATPTTPIWQEKIDKIRKTVEIARNAYPHSDKWLNMYADDVEDMLHLIDSMMRVGDAPATPSTPTDIVQARKWCDDNRKHPIIGKFIQDLQSYAPDSLAAIVLYAFSVPEAAPTTEPYCETCDTNDCECPKVNLPLPSPPAGQGREK